LLFVGFNLCCERFVIKLVIFLQIRTRLKGDFGSFQKLAQGGFVVERKRTAFALLPLAEDTFWIRQVPALSFLTAIALVKQLALSVFAFLTEATFVFIRLPRHYSDEVGQLLWLLSRRVRELAAQVTI